MDADGQYAKQVTSRGLSNGYGFVDFSLINGRNRKADGRVWEIDGR